MPAKRKPKRTAAEIARDNRLGPQLREIRSQIVAALVSKDWSALDTVDARLCNLTKRIEALEAEAR